MSQKFFLLNNAVKVIAYFLLGGILFTTSCVKDDLNEIKGDVMLKQSFSLPLGEKEMTIDTPLINDTCSTPGALGKFYYNGLPYACNTAIFPPIYEDVSLNLNSKTKSDWIKKLTFEIAVENGYPSVAMLEVYMVDEDGKVLDQLFGKSGIVISEATINADGYVTKPSVNVTEIIYEGDRLELLKQTKHLVYQATITSIFNKPVQLSDANKFKVDIGAKAELEYNAKDINN